MPMPPRPNEAFLLLQRLQQVKQTPPRKTEKLGPAMVSFFKSVERRQSKLGKIAEIWLEVVPEALNDHCALDSFNRGTLTVLVNSSSHLYELKQRLLDGLEKKLMERCKGSGLRKIALKAGQWDVGAE